MKPGRFLTWPLRARPAREGQRRGAPLQTRVGRWHRSAARPEFLCCCVHSSRLCCRSAIRLSAAQSALSCGVSLLGCGNASLYGARSPVYVSCGVAKSRQEAPPNLPTMARHRSARNETSEESFHSSNAVPPACNGCKPV